VAEQSGASRSERLAANLDELPGAVGRTILEFGAESSDDDDPVLQKSGLSPVKGISAHMD